MALYSARDTSSEHESRTPPPSCSLLALRSFAGSSINSPRSLAHSKRHPSLLYISNPESFSPCHLISYTSHVSLFQKNPSITAPLLARPSKFCIVTWKFNFLRRHFNHTSNIFKTKSKWYQLLLRIRIDSLADKIG